MDKQVVYGTLVTLRGDVWRKAQEFGIEKNEVRIICRACSMAEANQCCLKHGFRKKVYLPPYTTESADDFELNLCEQYEAWIQNPKTREYIRLSEFM